jgi:hypothetical protein
MSLACMASISHGQTFFANNGDQAAFIGSETETNPIPADLSTSSGWGVMSNSNLDGDAIRLWDQSGDRPSFQYDTPSPYTSYYELNFDGYIESGLTGSNVALMRLGPVGLNLGAFSSSSMEFRIRNFNGVGEMQIRTTTGQTFEAVTVGLDTRFSVSILANAAASGGSAVDYSKGAISGTLNPEQYAVIVNDSLVGTYTMYDTHTDNLGRFFLAGGTSAAGTSATIQIDNLTAVPEPGTYALIAGIFGLGLAIARRRRV